MANRLKVTGFARFFIFLLIAAPLIYSGAALFQGEHPLDAAKRDLGIDLRGSKEKITTPKTSSADTETNTDLIDQLKSENHRLVDEVNELKAKLKNCQ